MDVEVEWEESGRRQSLNNRINTFQMERRNTRVPNRDSFKYLCSIRTRNLQIYTLRLSFQKNHIRYILLLYIKRYV